MAEHERVEAPNSLMGKPDGDYIYVAELGVEVPSFVDPREDLISMGAHGFKRLAHHVPFNMRGIFKPQWLPPRHYAMYGHQYRTDTGGYTICASTRADGESCQARAVNRSPYCRNHGGALHPADKKLSSQNVSIAKIEPDRIENLDRVQKFLAGFIGVADLDDDEIIGAYVRNGEGRPIANERLGVRFQQEMVRELIRRMNRFMQMKLPNMLKAMTDIAESDFAEPADRIKAAMWIAERVIGKVPDVVVHGTTDKPYEVALARIEGGSREEYRSRVVSERADAQPLDVAVVDDETELEPDGDNGSNPNGNDTTLGHVGRMGETDVEPSDSGGNHNGSSPRVDLDGPSRAAIAKAAKDKLKAAKTRRFAARSQGIISGDVAWLIEYKKMKSGGFRAIIYTPEHQTQAVIDRIRDANLTIGA